jgi:DnaJ homolog subfamily C member 8
MGHRLVLVSETTGVYRAVKMNLANEGLEAKRKEEETLAKKRKAEEDANWEGMPLQYLPTTGADLWAPATANREQRVGSWRSFAKGSKKKKKQKLDILG